VGHRFANRESLDVAVTDMDGFSVCILDISVFTEVESELCVAPPRCSLAEGIERPDIVIVLIRKLVQRCDEFFLVDLRQLGIVRRRWYRQIELGAQERVDRDT